MIYREGVCCIGFTPDKKRIAVTKRQDLRVWCLPGGGIELGEKPEHAAAREFTEETGFYTNELTFQGIYDIKILKCHPFFWDRIYTYTGIIAGGKPRISDEVREIKLVEVDELPRGFLFYQKLRVQDAKNGIIHSAPVIQQIRVRDVLEAIIQNIQILIHPKSLYRVLTVTSPKQEA